MRRLYLLRHGTADPRPPDGADSPRRALVSKGRQQIERVAELLGRMDAAPTRVLSSPYLRARQSAEHLLDVLGLDLEIEIEQGLAAPSSLAAALEVVARVYEGTGEGARVLLAGHEPLLSELAAALCSAPDATIDLKKGGLVELDLQTPDSARLKGLIRPRHLV